MSLVCDCSNHEAAQVYYLFKGGILSANITSESSVMYVVSTQFTEQVATTANTECMRLSCKTIVLAGQPLHYVADLNGSGKYVCGPCFNYTQIKHLQLFLVCSSYLCLSVLRYQFQGPLRLMPRMSKISECNL